MGIRKELIEKETEMVVKEKRIMVGYVRQCRKKWRLVGVYVNGDIEQKLRKVEHWIEDKEDGVKTIIGRDFNAKTGKKGGRIVEGKETGG